MVSEDYVTRDAGPPQDNDAGGPCAHDTRVYLFSSSASPSEKIVSWLQYVLHPRGPWSYRRIVSRPPSLDPERRGVEGGTLLWTYRGRHTPSGSGSWLGHHGPRA